MAGSLIATFGSLVSIDVVNNLFNILNGLSPLQVVITSLSLGIEHLCGIKLRLELLSVFCSSQSDGKFLHLSLTLGKVLAEPDVGTFSIWHGFQDTLRSLQHYKLKVKALSLATFQRVC